MNCSTRKKTQLPRAQVDCALGRLWKRIADTPEMLSQWGMCAGREGERLQSDGS